MQLKVWGALAFSAAAVLLFTSPAGAQYLMMPDSTNNRLVYFNPTDGSLVNDNVFPLAGGTPVHAMQVGGEIWVSEQISDRISRWDFAGNSLGAVTGTIDNVRGMALINNTVYLTSTGTNNGAPGDSIHMFTTAGASLGFFATPFSDGFHILEHEGSILVSSSAANDDVHRYSFTGTSLGTFHNSTGLNFAEQMDVATNGEILVAGFSTNNIVRLDKGTGDIVGTYSASGARGLYQLGNGNILWTNSGGVHVLDVSTGASTQVYAGGGRFLDLVIIPEPATGTLVLSAAAGILALRRRTAR